MCTCVTTKVMYHLHFALTSVIFTLVGIRISYFYYAHSQSRVFFHVRWKCEKWEHSTMIRNRFPVSKMVFPKWCQRWCFSATELSARIHCTGCTRGLFSVTELVYTFGTWSKISTWYLLKIRKRVLMQFNAGTENRFED